MCEECNETQSYRTEEDRRVVAVPESFIVYCMEKTKSEEHRTELKKLLKNPPPKKK